MFNNQNVVVTGGSRGIGKATVRMFGQLGANLIINYNKSKEEAEQLARSVREGSPSSRIYCFPANVSDYGEVEKLMDFAVETLGSIDILVNSAGITRDGLLMRMEEAEYDEVVKVNQNGVYNCMRAASYPMIKQRKGSIINIASMVGVTGNKGQINYVASKAAVLGMTKAAALELASRGIRVNAVAPGFIDTEMTQKLSSQLKERLLSEIPLNRVGMPDEIASAVKFLASNDASYITGQTIHVNGGMYLQ